MGECIDFLGNAAVFSSLDANSGYWQTEIGASDKYKTAFTSHHGLYRLVFALTLSYDRTQTNGSASWLYGRSYFNDHTWKAIGSPSVPAMMH